MKTNTEIRFHPSAPFATLIFQLCVLALLPQRAPAQTVQYAFTNFAGMSGGAGNVDGSGLTARFSLPVGLGIDKAGSICVADAANHTIRKVTSSGVVTTLAGAAGQAGSADGVGSAARFRWPAGMAVDDAGNLYVADSGNFTIRKITPAGAVTTLAGSAGQSGSDDGPGSGARFALLGGLSPSGLAVDHTGNLYVADSGNHAIRKVTPAGVVSTLAGRAGQSGTNDGVGAAARFFRPTGVAVDSVGNLFVVDSLNLTIRKITPAGDVTTLAGSPGQRGSSDGTGSAARFGLLYYYETGWPSGPSGLTIDPAGLLYLADLQSDTIRKITTTGVVTTLSGNPGQFGYADGPAGQARFARPGCVAADSNGYIYVADSENDTIRKITPAGDVTTLAGSPPIVERKDGAGATARFDGPQGVAIAQAGNLYVPENGIGRTVRKISPAGIVTTFAGCTNQPSWANCDVRITDGVGNAARFSSPESGAIDRAGNVYIGDAGAIRKITPDGVVTTLAGRFSGVLRGIAVDGTDNIYVADTGDSRIIKITPDGRVTNFAGSAGKQGSLDATGNAARFKWPVGMAMDSAGTLYVAEVGNHTIRKISPAGVVTTLAGNASITDTEGMPLGGYADGTGGAARFNRPSGVALDLSGNLLVADEQNNAIRKVTPSGVVTTLAGTPGRAGGADGTGSAAQFSGPEAVGVDSAGALYVIDSFRVTKGTPILVPEPRFDTLSVNNGAVTTQVSGLVAGWTLVVESSINLRDWSPIQTNVASGSSQIIGRPINPNSTAEFLRASVK